MRKTIVTLCLTLTMGLCGCAVHGSPYGNYHEDADFTYGGYHYDRAGYFPFLHNDHRDRRYNRDHYRDVGKHRPNKEKYSGRHRDRDDHRFRNRHRDQYNKPGKLRAPAYKNKQGRQRTGSGRGSARWGKRTGYKRTR